MKNSGSNENSLLRIENASISFGGVKAVRDVSFEVQKGAIQALIGPNGAGKTTLFNLITGVFPLDSGHIYFQGQDAAKRKNFQRVSMGIARTFQNVELFTGMTVLENVMVGQHVRTKTGFLGAIARLPKSRREEAEIREKAMHWLKFVGLDHAADSRAGDLAFGWQRSVEIARALASEPQLLLLDEPAAGLNANETGQLGDLMRQIRDLGVTLLLVEHDMSLTMEISDRIVVLDQGAKLSEGAPREVQADEKVIAAYLGT
ncbi:amino acid/amide ABC transporter ATP-binding protein 1, HAAT family [Desulfatibacillum alkenivorans DSM 16219]|jgi:branched-chain amino acid transport system ATP-binding protein|uniref:Amino acid/amide ABC transporter ATP-binding protein 1, HAAT family n=1 Tax=Desulfatibacillum alkenivorans DSM 16219 TaxID=1121393 RepID=A0A1M6CZ28_9BACT|nr:ABC transporter ATP-binding protein [Desulfatibacillum alkenivorans]SHI66123.1 amino acid/amide ABC transporter ATP-binding protein 1, HAAT family [Desulfatibacillum alkenivorans DSM 16219]